MEQVAEHRPQELRLRMPAFAQGGELRHRVLRLQDLDHFIGGLAVGGAVVLLFEVEDHDVLADLAEDAGTGLLPERAFLDQRREQLGRLEVLVPRIVGQRVSSEEHTSELQSLMRRSYTVCCLKKKKKNNNKYN